MARNADNFDLITGKLSEQRSASELNACDVKELLNEKMTGDNSCTAEQLELIKSIISQAIADERKMSGTFTDVMLRSWLSQLDVKNTKSLESHVAMLEMIAVQRDLISNFSANLITRLGTLSTDATSLLASCRSSVDAAVTTNELTIENMTRLLDDTVSIGIKSQINETESMRDDHQKRSDEQTNKVVATMDEQKNDFAATGNDISKMVTSINNHTKLFAATMKSSKVKVIEHFDKQKTIAAAAFANIESKISDGIEKMKNSSPDITDIVNYNVHKANNWEK